MKNSLYILAVLVLIGAAFSFTLLGDIEVPERKIAREVEKLFDTEDFVLIEKEQSDINCVGEENYSKQLVILQEEKELGNVFIRRVRTCDPNACEEGATVEASTNPEDLEFFDYYAIVDTDKMLKSLTVFNYQATHGHEVAKRNWLSQFLEKQSEEPFVYGETIDAISGATVSAQNFTYEMEYVLDCLKRAKE